LKPLPLYVSMDREIWEIIGPTFRHQLVWLSNGGVINRTGYQMVGPQLAGLSKGINWASFI